MSPASPCPRPLITAELAPARRCPAAVLVNAHSPVLRTLGSSGLREPYLTAESRWELRFHAPSLACAPLVISRVACDVSMTLTPHWRATGNCADGGALHGAQ